jgi:hypothetical protein
MMHAVRRREIADDVGDRPDPMQIDRGGFAAAATERSSFNVTGMTVPGMRTVSGAVTMMRASAGMTGAGAPAPDAASPAIARAARMGEIIEKVLPPCEE